MELNFIEPLESYCSVPSKNCSFAMAFVPVQPWEELYSEEDGFEAGTVFPSLDKPFECGGDRK